MQSNIVLLKASEELAKEISAAKEICVNKNLNS